MNYKDIGEQVGVARVSDEDVANLIATIIGTLPQSKRSSVVRSALGKAPKQVRHMMPLLSILPANDLDALSKALDGYTAMLLAIGSSGPDSRLLDVIQSAKSIAEGIPYMASDPTTPVDGASVSLAYAYATAATSPTATGRALAQFLERNPDLAEAVERVISRYDCYHHTGYMGGDPALAGGFWRNIGTAIGSLFSTKLRLMRQWEKAKEEGDPRQIQATAEAYAAWLVANEREVPPEVVADLPSDVVIRLGLSDGSDGGVPGSVIDSDNVVKDEDGMPVVSDEAKEVIQDATTNDDGSVNPVISPDPVRSAVDAVAIPELSDQIQDWSASMNNWIASAKSRAEQGRKSERQVKALAAAQAMLQAPSSILDAIPVPDGCDDASVFSWLVNAALAIARGNRQRFAMMQQAIDRASDDHSPNRLSIARELQTTATPISEL